MNPTILSQLTIPTLIVLMLFLGFRCKDFLRDALSENKSPSSFRLLAFLLTLCVIYCEIFHTIKKESFDTQHLLYILLAILVLLGIVKFSQITDFVRGKSSITTLDKLEVTKETTTTTDKNTKDEPKVD